MYNLSLVGTMHWNVTENISLFKRSNYVHFIVN